MSCKLGFSYLSISHPLGKSGKLFAGKCCYGCLKALKNLTG